MIQARTALFLVLLAACSTSWAVNILIVTPFAAGDTTVATGAAQANAHVARLEGIFNQFDFSVDRSLTIPDAETLARYQQVWDIWAGVTEVHPMGVRITDAESQRYIQYMSSGGRLVVFGDHGGFPERNKSVVSLIQAAGGGTTPFTSPAHTPGTNQSPQIIQFPFTNPRFIGDGNNEVTFIAAGGVTSAGKGQFISKDPQGSGTALAFAPGTMLNARNGTLIVIFDMNIIDEAGPTRPDFADYGALLGNITDYVQSREGLPPLPDVATLQCREPATSTNPTPPLQACAFQSPMGVAVRDGTVYVADQEAHAVYKIDRVTQQRDLIAGLQLDLQDAPDVRYNGDGIDGRQALLNNPTGLGLDSDGNLYIVDTGNHAIRRLGAVDGVVPVGAMITTVAGVPTQFGVGDPALLFGPMGAAFDSADNLFIADTMNQVVRRREADGSLSVVAGIPGFPGRNNGRIVCPPLPEACIRLGQLNKPVGVALGSEGEIYIGDEGNNRVRVVSGSPPFVSGSTPGDIPPRMRRPTAVVTLPDGNVLTADYGNHIVRKVAPCEDCSGPANDWVAGTGEPGSSPKSLNSPIGLAYDSESGTVYIADLGNKRIGVVQLNP